MPPDPFSLAGETFTSRLLLGTAGYPNQRILVDAAAASGCEIVTVAICVRVPSRIDPISGPNHTVVPPISGMAIELTA